MPDDGDSSGDDILRREFDWDGPKPASVAVVEALEEFTGRDARSFSPLYDVVDADALDSLFVSTDETDRQNSGHLTLLVDESRVTLHSDGSLVVQRD